MFNNTQSCAELQLTWFGCPHCGQPKYTKAQPYFGQVSKAMVDPNEKTTWENQVVECIQCHQQYNRQDGFIRIPDLAPALQNLVNQNRNVQINEIEDLNNLTYLELRGVQIAPVGPAFWAWWKKEDAGNNKQAYAAGYYLRHDFCGIMWVLYLPIPLK